jgi:hypothetical protein
VQPFGSTPHVFFFSDYNEVTQLTEVDHVRP